MFKTLFFKNDSPDPPWAAEMLSLIVWVKGKIMKYEIRYLHTQLDWLIGWSRAASFTPSKINNIGTWSSTCQSESELESERNKSP